MKYDQNVTIFWPQVMIMTSQAALLIIWWVPMDVFNIEWSLHYLCPKKSIYLYFEAVSVVQCVALGLLGTCNIAWGLWQVCVEHMWWTGGPHVTRVTTHYTTWNLSKMSKNTHFILLYLKKEMAKIKLFIFSFFIGLYMTVNGFFFVS